MQINSVAFSPNGSQIVSACGDYRPGTIKVWDAANPRPYLESEWEEVEGDGEEDYDEELDMEFPYWKNSITGDVQQDKPSGAGEGMMNRDQKHGTINAWEWEAGSRPNSNAAFSAMIPDAHPLRLHTQAHWS